MYVHISKIIKFDLFYSDIYHYKTCALQKPIQTQTAFVCACSPVWIFLCVTVWIFIMFLVGKEIRCHLYLNTIIFVNKTIFGKILLMYKQGWPLKIKNVAIRKFKLYLNSNVLNIYSVFNHLYLFLFLAKQGNSFLFRVMKKVNDTFLLF